jgi:predicted amidohydrolase
MPYSYTYEGDKMDKNEVRLCVAQISVVPGDIGGNRKRIVEYMDKAGYLGADIVLFPEMTTCDYVRDMKPFEEPVPGPTTEVVSAKAKQYSMWAVVGLNELDGAHNYNSAVLIDREGNIAGRYHKIHLSTHVRGGAAFNEKGGTLPNEGEMFDPGSEYPVFETDFGTIGIMICKDGLFPEVSRILSLNGAEIVFWSNSRHFLNPAHLEAIANLNRVILVTANRAAEVWQEGGGSAIVMFEKPDDRHTALFLATAGTGETILIADVDVAAARRKRKLWIEQWSNRRPDTYGALVR